jgi:membrane-associated phospholipid phosphatase
MGKAQKAAAAVLTLAVAPGLALAATAPADAAPRAHEAAAAPAGGHIVAEWNQQLISLIAVPGAQPASIHPTRSFALLQAAEYDAVTSITHGPAPYLFSVNASPGARPDVAVAQAAHDVLVSLYPAAQRQLDDHLRRDLDAAGDDVRTREGRAVGRLVATLLGDLRAFDGSASTPPSFVAGTGPGEYRPTPPNFPTPAFTGWGRVTPFVLSSGDQVRPPAPAAVTTAEYAAALNTVKDLGRDTSATRTADQTAAAKFWSAAPVWNVWNQLAQRETLDRGLSLQQAVRMFAALDVSLADTAIALYDAKYHFLVWRPVTAIRAADTTGNPDLTADPNWTPLSTTAPDPSYPGAHSAFSRAAATVLTDFFRGGDSVRITTDPLPGVARTFSGFSSAASEAGASRIWAGQHTPIDDNAGQVLGGKVAGLVLSAFDKRQEG